MKLNNRFFSDESMRQRTARPGNYKDFDATELYCPRCQRAVPVRKRLLLVIPEGNKYEYVCAFCSQTVGTKIDREIKPVRIIV
jgi:DNA-directed RNA polymerase subunit RPC12/RpoP